MEFMFSVKGTKMLIIFFNQAYFKVDSPKLLSLYTTETRNGVIKRKSIRLTLIEYLFQTGTNSACAM